MSSSKQEGKPSTLKRKLFNQGGVTEDDGERKVVTKRRRSQAASGDESPSGTSSVSSTASVSLTPGTPKSSSAIPATGSVTAGGNTTPNMARHGMPLSERQQISLLMQMTAPEQGDSSPHGARSPPPSSAVAGGLGSSSVGKKTPLDRKVNKRNERGETMLHLAAKRGDVKQTRKLIKAGANVNIRDYAGWTPLHEACNHGWADVARQLLKAGAIVNVQGLDNDTPLHDAAGNGHEKVVEILMRHGANPSQVNSKGKSPLDIGASDTIMRILRQEIPLPIVGSSSGASCSSSDEEQPYRAASPDILSDKEMESPVPVIKRDQLDATPGYHHGSGSHLASTHTQPIYSKAAGNAAEDQKTSCLDDPYALPLSPPSHQPYQHPTPHSTSSIFKKVHVSRHMDKSASPRLTLKFQHIKPKENRMGSSGPTSTSSSSLMMSPARSRSNVVTSDTAKYKTYSVSLGSTPHGEDYEKGVYSPAGSTSSQESDLYDPKLEITTFGSKRGLPRPVPSSESSTLPESSSQSRLCDSAVDSSSGSQADSQMPMLSQESGPFTPNFDETEGEDRLQKHRGVKRDAAESDSPKVSGFGVSSRNSPSCGRSRGGEVSSSSDSKSNAGISKHSPSSSTEVSDVLHSKGPDAHHSKSDSHHGKSDSHHVKSDSHGKIDTHHGKSDSHHGKSDSYHVKSDSYHSRSDNHHNKSDSHHNKSDSHHGKSDAHHSKSDGHSKSDSHHSKSDSHHSKSDSHHSRSDSHHSKVSEGHHNRTVRSKDTSPSDSSSAYAPASSVAKDSKLTINTDLVTVTSRDKVSPRAAVTDKSLSPGSSRLSPRQPDCAISPGQGSPASSKVEKEKAYHNRGERENTRSPKPSEGKTSPKLDQHRSSPKIKIDTNRASPKPISESRDSRDSKDSRDSPKSDNGRPSSPKVPPLKIIMHTKTTASVEHDTRCQKSVQSKTALPYVVEVSSAGGGEAVVASCESGSSTETQNNLAEQETSSAVSSSQNQLPVTSDIITRKTRSRVAAAAAASSDDKSGEQSKESSVDVEDGDTKDSGTSSTSSKRADDGHEDKKDETQTQPSERRLTRSFARSQQREQEQKTKDVPSSSKDDSNKEDKDSNHASTSSRRGNGSSNHSNQEKQEDDISIHPRKRKLRHRHQQAQQNETPSDTNPPLAPLQHIEKPDNPYEMYLDIRKKVARRRQQWLVVQPKAPQGFRDYLMVSCNYLLKGNLASHRSVPTLTAPPSLPAGMRELFEEQERTRYKLRLQHVIEREKLMLSIEQEIVRVHGRAARAMANQATPLSVCTILRDEDIYNTIDTDDVSSSDDKSTARSRYNGRQFLSWLQDVDDKFEKIKESLLMRHHHEAESLHAVQKLEWEWRLKELKLLDHRSVPQISPLHVPMVQVNDDFDLLPA